jgi:hypothetical protein
VELHGVVGNAKSRAQNFHAKDLACVAETRCILLFYGFGWRFIIMMRQCMSGKAIVDDKIPFFIELCGIRLSDLVTLMITYFLFPEILVVMVPELAKCIELTGCMML